MVAVAQVGARAQLQQHQVAQPAVRVHGEPHGAPVAEEAKGECAQPGEVEHDEVHRLAIEERGPAGAVDPAAVVDAVAGIARELARHDAAVGGQAQEATGEGEEQDEHRWRGYQRGQVEARRARPPDEEQNRRGGQGVSCHGNGQAEGVGGVAAEGVHGGAWRGSPRTNVAPVPGNRDLGSGGDHVLFTCHASAPSASFAGATHVTPQHPYDHVFSSTENPLPRRACHHRRPSPVQLRRATSAFLP